jgi:preprotein translocase subunit SecY
LAALQWLWKGDAVSATKGANAGLDSLKGKILWTFLLLAVYRVGIHLPIPGVDGKALADFFASVQNTLFGLFDMFSGGGLRNLSIFALGIMPYISASIILQLLTVVSPELKRLSREEGAAGRKKITQYTRYGTVLISVVQGLGIAVGVESMSSPTGASVVYLPGWGFRAITVITLTAGTVFLMWLGEKITEKGIGNGISLIIFAGIVAGLPSGLGRSFRLLGAGELSLFTALLLLVFMAAVLVGIVFVERCQRRIPIHYAKRMIGRKLYGGQTSHLPLRLNTAGVIPPIFASSLLMFQATLANFSHAEILQRVSEWFRPDTVLYNILFIGLIIFFCYFYTAIIFDPKEIAENLKKQGAFVPGIRPGQKTEEYLDKVLNRLTLWGALYISIVCVLPVVLMRQFHVPFYFGGTSLLIVVGVAMDTMSQVQSHLISGQYEGLLAKARVKGRRA